MKKANLVLILVFGIVSFVSAQRAGNCEEFGELPRGKVKVRNKGRVIKFACNRGYTLIGSEVATCIRREWILSVGTPPLCIANGCKALATPPNGRLQLEYGGAIARIKCNPGYYLQKDAQALLFCDGYDWNGTLPMCRSSSSSVPTVCNFEEDFCFWSQDAGHHIDWERQRFATPSGYIGTGPSFDHTLGEGNGGYYIYLEASGTRSVNDTARLFSPFYKPELSRDSCFIFWYHMYGATMGTLSVYVKPESKSFLQSKLLFQQSGNLGNQWILAVLPLDEINENFQIVIEGLRGPSYMSDMAIDDVKLGKGEECQPPPTVPTTETTSKATISPFLSCNGKCGSTPTTPDGNVCSCTTGCLSDFNCCRDYTVYCSGEITAGVTAEPAMTSTVKQEAITVVETTTPATTTSSLASVANTQQNTTFTVSTVFNSEIISTTLKPLDENITTFSSVTENTTLLSASSQTDSPPTPNEVKTLSSVVNNVTTVGEIDSTTLQTVTYLKTTLIPTVSQTMTVTPETTAVSQTTAAQLPTTTVVKTTPSTTTKQRETTTVVQTTTITPISSSKQTSTTKMTTTQTTSSPSTSAIVTTTSLRTAPPPSKIDLNYVDDTQIYSNEISQSGFQGGEIETATTPGLSIIIVASILGLTACVTVAVVVTVLRRRRMSDERQGRLPEDSDVRYLHNDEEVQLDFTEQQPKNNRKSMNFGFENL